jgi:hypothetical protein
MQPEPPRYPFIRPIVPLPPELLVCLTDVHAVTLFVQLGRLVRNIDRSLPDVEHDTQIALLPDLTGQSAPESVRHVPRLYLFERGQLDYDATLLAFASQLRATSTPGPSVLTTTKRSFCNYLHPRLIQEQLGVTIEMTDRTDVPLQVALAPVAKEGRGWAFVPAEEQRQRLEEAKRLLVTRVAPAMTPELLTERKGKADVSRWLYAIKLNLPPQFYD